MKTNLRKSQTATEYLIILAVVVVIAIVAINTLGGFPGIGGNNIKKVSDYKLQTDTVGIESYSIGTNSSMFKIKNNYFDTITVIEFRVNQQTNLTCNSSNTNPMLPIVLNVGQSMIVNCSAVNSSNYVITNKQTPIIGLSYTDSLGATRTAGNVNSYGNVSSGSQISDVPYVPSATVLALRNGLVAYYPLDGNTSDVSGNSVNGNNFGATYTQSGKVGSAYSFDGSDYIDLSAYSNSFPLSSSSRTIAMWMKPETNRGTMLYYGYSGNYYQEMALEVGYPSSGNIYWERWGNDITTSYDTSDGNWHLVVFRYSNEEGNVSGIWVDGNIQIAGDVFQALNTPSGYSARIGAAGNAGSTGSFYKGFLDEVAIWNRSLNTTEILQLYNESNGLSLSLSGPKIPFCGAGQSSCNGTHYLLCNGDSFVDQGEIIGNCGYFNPVSLSNMRQGLIAYYPFDGNISDLSGNGNTGTNNGATYNLSGKVGGAYRFDGNDYINVPNSASLNPSNLTVSVWVNANSVNQFGEFLTKRADSDYGAWILYGGSLASGGNFESSVYHSSCGFATRSQLTSGGSIQAATWYLVSFTTNSTDLSIYVNGNLSSTVSYSQSVCTGRTDSIRLGTGCCGRYFTGLMDEVAIWNRSLSANEIMQLYNNSNGYSLSLSGAQTPICVVNQTDCNGTSYLNCSNGNWVNNGNVSGQCGYAAPGNVSSLRVGLVGYWPLDDAGTTFNDSSGNSHTGSCVGTCPSIVSGKLGSARNFSSSNNAITIANSNSFPSGTSSRTVCAWANGAILDHYEWAFSYGSGSSCEFVGACGTAACHGRWGNGVGTSSGYLTTGVWYLLCYTYDGSTAKGYVNTDLFQTKTTSWSLTPGGAFIGRQSYLSSEYWKGAVDEVAIWNRALNSTEIAQLYDSGNGLSLVQ